ncbi:hypothetical protein IQ266_22695 [filamentous cyanobacterium LEGE 11480]|uniref:Uncharacterized protein n=1 Tax=Romeriopsis navalis LEGE 11480 TaxID=2777977 RepID=A0A928Z608_9CYAN|nr:hypothetical protein [Romeriopsis navalis]MBE9032552.1 hypothetical protein [Romeriopsis navalis LEGE 11480]
MTYIKGTDAWVYAPSAIASVNLRLNIPYRANAGNWLVSGLVMGVTLPVMGWGLAIGAIAGSFPLSMALGLGLSSGCGLVVSVVAQGLRLNTRLAKPWVILGNLWRGLSLSMAIILGAGAGGAGIFIAVAAAVVLTTLVTMIWQRCVDCVHLLSTRAYSNRN